MLGHTKLKRDYLLVDLNTVHSCSRFGLVAARLTAKRPGSGRHSPHHDPLATEHKNTGVYLKLQSVWMFLKQSREAMYLHM